MKENPLVEGVMFLGGVARNFADEDSDIDIAVFSHKKLMDLQVGECFDEEGNDIEIWNVKLDEGFEEWDQEAREAYSEGVIAFDRNGLVRDFLDKVLFYSDEAQVRGYGYRLFHMAWHGFVYSKYRNKFERGYKWVLPDNLWYKRGNPQNGFVVMQDCAKTLIETLFVINKAWIPDTKWLWIKSLKLEYLPKDYENKMAFILFSEFSDANYPEKCRLFQELLDESFEVIQDRLPENLYSIIDFYD